MISSMSGVIHFFNVKFVSVLYAEPPQGGDKNMKSLFTVVVRKSLSINVMLSLHAYSEALCCAMLSFDDEMSIAFTCAHDKLNGMVLPPTPQNASVIVLEDDEGMIDEM